MIGLRYTLSRRKGRSDGFVSFISAMSMASIALGVMALINLPVIVILSRPALAALKDYVTQRKAGKDPVFRAADIGLAGKTECWQ